MSEFWAILRTWSIECRDSFAASNSLWRLAFIVETVVTSAPQFLCPLEPSDLQSLVREIGSVIRDHNDAFILSVRTCPSLKDEDDAIKCPLDHRGPEISCLLNEQTGTIRHF
jgi:hypothetical protein